jgi:glycosyltransferase involved in cell wall biosynthesis
MLTIHGAAGTWKRKVDRYIALSEFARQKFIAGGLPENRIFVKPNFVDRGELVRRSAAPYALFAGRLSPEKGLQTMAEAWTQLKDIPLVVAGDGPLKGAMAAQEIGAQPREIILEKMSEARVLIFPSLWYEGAPMAIAEAFACGLPVIASRLGSMAETVRDGETGALFRAGDAADLAEKVRWAFGHPREMEAMGRAARREYEEKYSAPRNYDMLMAIYESAIGAKRRESRAAS